MILAHRIQLEPNNKQQTYLTKACGVARFSYNWALSEWKRLYDIGEKVSEGSLRKKISFPKYGNEIFL
jgi:putative transposase